GHVCAAPDGVLSHVFLSNSQPDSSAPMPATSEHPEEYWTERYTSKRTRTGVRTLQRWRSEGRGPPYVRFGPRKILYRRSAVEAWIREREFKHRADELSREVRT